MFLIRFFSVLEGEICGVSLCLLNSLFYMYWNILLDCIVSIRNMISCRLWFLKFLMGSVSRVGMCEM